MNNPNLFSVCFKVQDWCFIFSVNAKNCDRFERDSTVKWSCENSKRLWCIWHLLVDCSAQFLKRLNEMKNVYNNKASLGLSPLSHLTLTKISTKTVNFQGTWGVWTNDPPPCSPWKTRGGVWGHDLKHFEIYLEITFNAISDHYVIYTQ